MVTVGKVILLHLSLLSGYGLMLLVALRLGLLGAVYCFASAAPVRVGYFLPLPAALCFTSVLLFCVVVPRSWAGSPSWSVPFGVSRCCLCCYTYSGGYKDTMVTNEQASRK